MYGCNALRKSMAWTFMGGTLFTLPHEISASGKSYATSQPKATELQKNGIYRKYV